MHLPLPSFTPDHLHPILVNFTAALVPASVGSDLFGRVLRKAVLHTAAWWMLVYAAVLTPLTVLSGVWWKHGQEGMLPPRLIAQHQWLGMTLAIVFLVLAAWRYRAYRKDMPVSAAYLTLGVLAVAALVVQGALGGEMLLGG